MGSDRHYPEEAPVHRVTVDGFWIDRTPVTNRQFPRLRRRDRPRHVRRETARSEGLSRRLAADAVGRLAGLFAPDHPVDLRDWSQWWTFRFGANWRQPTGRRATSTVSTTTRSFTSPTPMRSLCALGRQGSADRGGMGVRRPRRARRRRVRLGRRIHARRPAHGQHLAGRVPARKPLRRRLCADLAGKRVSAERLRPLTT